MRDEKKNRRVRRIIKMEAYMNVEIEEKKVQNNIPKSYQGIFSTHSDLPETL